MATPTELPGPLLYYITLCYVVLRYVTLNYIILYYIILFCFVILCYVILFYIILCYFVLCYVILCYVLLYYIILYYIILYYIILHFALPIVNFKAHFCNFFCSSDKKIEINLTEFIEIPTYLKFDTREVPRKATLRRVGEWLVYVYVLNVRSLVL